MFFVDGLPNSATLTIKIFDPFLKKKNLIKLIVKVTFDRNYTCVILVHYLWQIKNLSSFLSIWFKICDRV